jgi:DNA invertase Pin-like site-specific DNA recombinase
MVKRTPKQAVTQQPRAPRCLLYARFSNAVQEGGTSIERQVELAERYAAQHGLELDHSLKLRDHAVSAFRGKNRDEGALGELLKLIASGDIPAGSTVLIESVSRLSRMPQRKARRILEEIVEAHVAVVFMDSQRKYTLENIDDLGHDITFTVESHAAHKLSADLQRYRTAAWKRAQERARESRQPATRMVPRWIDVPTTRNAKGRVEHGKPQLIPERAKVVRRIFKDYLAGAGKESIAKALNEEGVPTWDAGKRTAPHWRHTYISKILVNRAVIGEYHPHTTERVEGGPRRRKPNGDPIPNFYPAVIGVETFNRAQVLLKANRPVKGAKLRTSRAAPKHLLATLLRCGHCGAAVRREAKGEVASATNAGPKYRCETVDVGGKCSAPRTPVRLVEQCLCDEADRILLSMPRTDAALEEEIEGLEHVLIETADTYAYLQDELDDLVRRHQPIPDALAQKLASMEAERKEWMARVAEAHRQYERVETRYITQRVEHMRDMLKAYAKDPSSITAANTALREVFEKATIDTTTGELTLVWRHGKPVAPPAEGTVLVYDSEAWADAHFEDHSGSGEKEL